ncbi:hypothetical protein [Microcoleus sp. S28C3]|uniref:hypothetical protein n=1 Tax=Microcoleus sp. S28C3 TaxID=3055414 RepID=UPI002FD4DBCE
MPQIESIFFYRSFLCWCDRRGGWEIKCLDYGYLYPGKVGGAVAAKRQVDEFLNQRYGPKPDRQQQP